MKIYCILIILVFFPHLGLSQDKYIYVETKIQTGKFPYISQFFISVDDSINEENYKSLIVKESIVFLLNNLENRIYISEDYLLKSAKTEQEGIEIIGKLEKSISSYYYIAFEYDNIQIKFAFVNETLSKSKMIQIHHADMFYYENGNLKFNNRVNNECFLLSNF